MSKSGWGVLVSFAITVLSVAVPIPEWLRGYVIFVAVVLLGICGVQYFRAHSRERLLAKTPTEIRRSPVLDLAQSYLRQPLVEERSRHRLET